MKTNATRLLDTLGIRYELRDYEVDVNDLGAIKVAGQIERERKRRRISRAKLASRMKTMPNRARPLVRARPVLRHAPAFGTGGTRSRSKTQSGIGGSLCANTDPQRACRADLSRRSHAKTEAWRRRDSLFTKGPADVLDHAASEIAIGSKPGIDATKKLPGEPRKRPLAKTFGVRGWPPLIKMDEAVKAKVEKLFK